MKIFLDDIRDAPVGWARTYTAEETIELLANNNVTEISLDHDLGEGIVEGYKVLTWIEEQVYSNFYIPPIIHIHTANPAGRKRMVAAVKNIEKLRR